MPTTGTSCRLCRRGTSTILGTLIFVGILFTAFIPMMLVMRQADTLHEMRKHELASLDEEHYREDISYYAYPLDLGSNQIYVKIENKGSAPVKIVRVWINDVEYPQDVNIKSMETISLDPLTVELSSQTSYSVKLTTEKGNVFSSEAGTLYYSGGGWYTSSLGICVHITNFRGKYWILIEKGTDILHDYKSPRVEHGEVIETFWVDEPGAYFITIKKDNGGTWVNVYPAYVHFVIDVIWPGPKPITDVYASGL